MGLKVFESPSRCECVECILRLEKMAIVLQWADVFFYYSPNYGNPNNGIPNFGKPCLLSDYRLGTSFAAGSKAASKLELQKGRFPELHADQGCQLGCFVHGPA